MYAIIETGGKQYRVAPGDVLSIEKLDKPVGQKITFDKVLLVAGGTDQKVAIGTPYVSSASLEAEVVEQVKGDKIRIIKYRRRKGYRRSIGHRQLLTRILVTKVQDGTGGSETFDTAKRADVLRKASVKFSTRQEKHQAEHEKKMAKPSEKKAEKKTRKKS